MMGTQGALLKGIRSLEDVTEYKGKCWNKSNGNRQRNQGRRWRGREGEEQNRWRKGKWGGGGQGRGTNNGVKGGEEGGGREIERGRVRGGWSPHFSCPQYHYLSHAYWGPLCIKSHFNLILLLPFASTAVWFYKTVHETFLNSCLTTFLLIIFQYSLELTA